MCLSYSCTRSPEASSRGRRSRRRSLRAGFRVIAYSRRGVGSTSPITTPINHAEDLGRVLDALGIQRAHLVTVAGGATVAADFLISHPDRVASAVLACSLISFQDPRLLAARRGRSSSAHTGRQAPIACGAGSYPRFIATRIPKARNAGSRYSSAQSAGLAPTAQTNEVTLEAIAATSVPLSSRLLANTILC